MRDIKFRAWDRKNNCWAKWDIPHWDTAKMNVCIGLPDNAPETFEMRDDDSFVFMQYTGLKDKNGKEIYEGDIVESLGHKYTIGYINQLALFALTINDKFVGEMALQDGTPRIIEVIGNIYQNPELLSAGIGGDKNG